MITKSPSIQKNEILTMDFTESSVKPIRISSIRNRLKNIIISEKTQNENSITKANTAIQIFSC